MSQETTLTFEVLDFKVKLLVNKLHLKIADIYIDVKDKSPTVYIIFLKMLMIIMWKK